MTKHPADFANRLTQAVRDLSAPEPSEALLARILEDRNRGQRINLPAVPRPRRRAVVIALVGALAAAVVLWIAPGPRGPSEASDKSAISELAIGMGFWPDQLYAQASTTSQLPPIPPRDGSLLKAGRWVYSVQTLDEDGRVTDERPISISIAPGSYQGSAAWLFSRQRVSANPGGRIDTVWMSRDSLHPLARFRPLLYGASLHTTYTGDSIVEVWRKADGGIVHTAAALPSPRLWDNAVVMSPMEILPLFLTTRLSASWQGSFAGTAVNNAGELVTLWWDLKVIGEQRVTVPAGSFDCWQVASMYDRDPFYMYWVDKTTGWIIREGVEPNGRYARVLVSHAAD